MIECLRTTPFKTIGHNHFVAILIDRNVGFSEERKTREPAESSRKSNKDQQET